MKVLFVSLVMLLGLHAQEADPNLVQGLLEEEVNLDYAKAIENYRAILTKFEDQQRLAATAVYRLAECYRKQDDAAKASKHYRQVIDQFPEQEDLIAQCKVQLKAMGEQIPSRTVKLPLSKEEQTALDRAKRMLVESPDRLNAVGKDGTPLTRAIEANHMEVMRFLLDNDADPNLGGALHTAARLGYLGMTRHLLEQGAKVDLPFQYGRTALHEAVWHDRFEVAKLLLMHKANPERITSTYFWVEQGHQEEESDTLHKLDAFQLAIFKQRSKAWLSLLLKFGGNVNKAYHGRSFPIHEAVRQGWLEQIAFLIENGADLNVAHDEGLRPIHEVPNVAVLNLLQDGKIDLLAVDANNDNALHHAARRGDVDVCRNLIEAGLDPKSRGRYGSSVLHKAVSAKQQNLVTFLLESTDVDVNQASDSGSTPLMAACRNLADLNDLLNAGSNVNVKTRTGYTALYYAAHSGDIRKVTTLITAGADVFARNNSNQVTIEHFEHNAEISGYLLTQMKRRYEREKATAIWKETRYGPIPILKKSPRLGQPTECDAFVAWGSKMGNSSNGRGIDGTLQWGETLPKSLLRQSRLDLSAMIHDASREITIQQGEQSHTLTVYPSISERRCYLPTTPLMASRLSELLEHGHFPNQPTKATLTRAPKDGEDPVSFDIDLATVTPETDVWLRAGDTITLPDTKEHDGRHIRLSREDAFFETIIWNQDHDYLPRKLDGAPGAFVAPTVIDLIVAAFQQPESFFLPHPDWSRVELIRGDTRLAVPVHEWLDDPLTDLPDLQWGDRLNLPKWEKDSTYMSLHFSRAEAKQFQVHCNRKITINGRLFTLTPAFYNVSQAKYERSRSKMEIDAGADADSFWLGNVLDQLGYHAKAYDLTNISVNAQDVGDQTRTWLLDGDVLELDRITQD